jgi:alpha-tubulin suppressor-like RCC1 family protein
MPIGSDKGFIVKPGFNPLAEQTSEVVAGGLWSWGRNNRGQLGVGNTTSYSSPVQIGVLTTWDKFAAGLELTVAGKDGTLWGWGKNADGQLGQGNTTDYSSPVQVGALTTWLQIAAAPYGEVVGAVKTDGTLWTWGYGILGSLGHGNTTNYSSPVQVGSETYWADYAAGVKSGAATTTGGKLYAWGYGIYGQLGQGNTTDYSSPVQVGALTNWSKVFAGKYCYAAIKTDGTLWSWGSNDDGKLGIGVAPSTSSVSSPSQIGSLTTWAKFAWGADSGHAIKTDGTLWSWGGNAVGQLGTGNVTYYSSPVQIGALTNWADVACGDRNGVAVTTGGALYVWGFGGDGRLGLGNTTNYSSPVQLGSLTTWGQTLGGICAADNTVAIKG